MKPLVSQFLQHAAATSLLFGLALFCEAGARAQSAPAPENGPIARIEGDDIALHGEVNLVHETGRHFAELANGSEVNVRSGKARIELLGGGEIGICGPAKFTLLRSGTTLTLALDYGHIDAHLNEAQAVTIYTPLAVATPVSISGGTDELRLGLEQTGRMCLYAARGAVRVQPQFGDEPVVVPQDVEAAFSEGHLDSVAKAPHTCSCDALAAFATPVVPSLRVEASVIPAGESSNGTNNPSVEKKADPIATPTTPATEEPIWKVVMPPLSFDVSARGAAQLPKPETILLFREVRVESGAVFHGTVAPRAATPTPSVANARPESMAAHTLEKKPSFGARVKNFFRRLFGGKPKSLSKA